MLRCTNPECRQAESFKKVVKRFLGIPIKYTTLTTKELKETILECVDDMCVEVPLYIDSDDEKLKCPRCRKKDTVKELKHAYEDPMLYFDTGNLCKCGGEIWQDVEVVKLDTDESDDFEGTQRKSNIRTQIILRCERCEKTFK